MRPAPPSIMAAAVANHLIHFTSASPPPLSPPPPAAVCILHGSCKWRPPSASASTSTGGTLGEFQAYAAIAVIILLCALICGLALQGTVRCFLRRPLGAQQQDSQPEKDVGEVVPATICPGPAVAFSPGIDMVGADECAICLTEFVEGEEIRLMAECRHGFHGQCIQRWLQSHSSCPNCRRNCLVNVKKSGTGEPSVSATDQQRLDIESQS